MNYVDFEQCRKLTFALYKQYNLFTEAERERAFAVSLVYYLLLYDNELDGFVVVVRREYPFVGIQTGNYKLINYNCFYNIVLRLYERYRNTMQRVAWGIFGAPEEQIFQPQELLVKAHRGVHHNCAL
ncbi:hypothetical protein [Mogibacterium diversum]|uniref:hypothetical protein n=1 Tax=Mogibacterium diversum TaxID=114527 RepID=UPI0026EA1459|nr:hypothetical protein [Mogibacterium diversum]